MFFKKLGIIFIYVAGELFFSYDVQIHEKRSLKEVLKEIATSGNHR